MGLDDVSGSNPDRPMFDPESIPESKPYPKRSPLESMRTNHRVRKFLAEAIEEIFEKRRTSYQRVADCEGQTYSEWAADTLMVRVSHEFPGVLGLLLEDDERVRPDRKNLGIGPTLGPVPEDLQLPVIVLTIAAGQFHRSLIDLFDSGKQIGLDLRGELDPHSQRILEESEHALQLWRDHLGIVVYEALRDIDA